VEIRRLGPDEEDLLRAAVRLLRDVEAPAPDLFLQDPRTHTFVAIDDGSVVGAAYGYELLRPEGRWMILLYEIGVAEPQRRQGVGRALMDAFVAFARSKGHTKMWLVTDAGNEAARRLYEGAGGEPTEELGYWWVFG